MTHDELEEQWGINDEDYVASSYPKLGLTVVYKDAADVYSPIRWICITGVKSMTGSPKKSGPTPTPPIDPNTVMTQRDVQKLEELGEVLKRWNRNGINSNSVGRCIKAGWDTFRTSCNFASAEHRAIGFNISMLLLTKAGVWLIDNAFKLNKGLGDSILFGNTH
jgi:hypothetical protein